MTLTPELLRVLVDPEDKGPLQYVADESLLYNPRLQRRYEVRRNEIPVLLVDEATGVDAEEHQRLIAKADAGGTVVTGPKELS